MKKFLAATALTLAPAAAFAHAGHDAGTFSSGVMHPLGGADHVLAMVAVGLLAAQRGGQAVWAMPAGFVGSMIAGALIGAAGLPFLSVEPLILASIIVLGVAVAMSAKLRWTATAPMIALFGMAHGWAHGAEGPASGLAAYVIGFALATGALHCVGLALGRAINTMVLRGLGGATAVAGLALAFAG